VPILEPYLTKTNINKDNVQEFKHLFTKFHLGEMSDIEVLKLALVIDQLRCELQAECGSDPKKFLELESELYEFARELQEIASE